MIQFTGYDLLWLFFIYSFAGWVLETAAATFMQPEIFQPWAGKWPVMYPVRCGSCCNVCGLAGTDRAMALFICIPVCSSYRVRRWKVN